LQYNDFLFPEPYRLVSHKSPAFFRMPLGLGLNQTELYPVVSRGAT